MTRAARFAAIAVAGLSLAGAAPPVAAGPPMGEPMLGTCHMDICSYSREVRRETLREAPSGRLLRVALLGGEQGDAGDDGPDESAPIVWDRRPHDIFVLCSTRLPAVMMRVAGQRTLQTDLLDFVGPSGIAQALMSSANLYMDICHRVRDEDWAEAAPRLGYRPLPEALQESGIDLARPEDIFGYVP